MIDFDTWRARHAEMSFADQQAFYEELAERYPVQESFDVAGVASALGAIDCLLDVIELGGWDGKLASIFAERWWLRSWTNYDLVALPQATSSDSYRLVVLKDYLWNLTPRPADVFIACHTIEHLTERELRSLVEWLDVRWVYLQAPLEAGPTDWDGYHGSHILEIGWAGVSEILTENGYRITPTVGLWERA